MKFAITGLFRSRTKWASAFLSTPDCPVLHDATIDQYATACAISTPLVLKSWQYVPKDTKIVLIDRPLEDVVASMSKYEVPEYNIRYLAKYKAQLIANREVLVMDFNNLDAKALWLYCHGTEISDEYVKVYEDMNITQQAMNKRLRAA
jgi:hypothetical protein